MAPYVIGAHILPFGKEPDTIAACGIMPDNDDDNAGVLAVGMTLTFKNSTTSASNNLGGSSSSSISRNSNSPPSSRSIASGIVGYLAESSVETLYAGKKGRIKILGPAHYPTSAILMNKSDGRGNGDTTTTTTGNNNNSMKAVEFPLPLPTEEKIESGGIQMPNSMGFIYEAETVQRLIAANYFTFPHWTPEENIGCIRTMEYILKQMH